MFTITLPLIGRYARLAATGNNAKVTWGILVRPELFTLAPVPALTQINKRVTVRDSAAGQLGVVNIDLLLMIVEGQIELTRVQRTL